MIRHAARDEQIRQRSHHIIRAKLVICTQRQTLPCIFIDHRERSDLRTVL